MDNKTLDGILITLRDKYGGNVDRFQFIKENPSLTTSWESCHTFLLRRNYIMKDLDGTRFIMRLTAEGERFLLEGGFTSDAQYKEQTLEVAKESKKYAKLAFWISVLGILVTIGLFLLDKLI